MEWNTEQRTQADQLVQARRTWILVFFLSLVTWIIIFPLLIPDRNGDRGIILSTAARMLAGDRLYAEVFDNKEPLFYYLVAAEMWLGWATQIAVEAILVALCSLAAFIILRIEVSRLTAMLIAGIAVPIIVTGDFYLPGLTHLPGEAVTLLAIAAAAKSRPVTVGIGLALVLFLKVPAFPVAAVAVAPFLLSKKGWKPVFHVAGAFIVTALAITLAMWFRGELIPFFEALAMNVQ